MAKTSYLNLINKVLRRVNQSEITDVSQLTGQSQIVADYLNEAQEELFNETNWYSLYTTRTFATVASTAEYAVQADFGRTIDLIDETNDRVLTEDWIRTLDEADPNSGTTGIPSHFVLQNTNYRLYPVPAGVYTIRERYWAQPTKLITNTDTTELPLETETCLTNYSYLNTLEYLNQFERADRVRLTFEKSLKKAMKANSTKIDILNKLKVTRTSRFPLIPVTIGANYER